MIEVQGLSKQYGDTLAVDDLSFIVRPGVVTGFLGPNGAGKTTTMRLILGLDRPSAGVALVNGRPLADHPDPMAQIGALLEAKAVHPKRSARNHLRAVAATSGIADRRVDEVLQMVGLGEVADRNAGGFSLGMSQRLGIAATLLADPETVMLDEPVNGLDPEGIVWVRNLLKGLAAEGHTVFVSSHLMSEMAMTADHFIIVGRGQLVANVSANELEAMSAHHRVFVRTPDGEALRSLVAADGVEVTNATHVPDGYDVAGVDSDTIGRLAASTGLVLLELTPRRGSLEQTFMQLTHGSVDYHALTDLISTNT